MVGEANLKAGETLIGAVDALLYEGEIVLALGSITGIEADDILIGDEGEDTILGPGGDDSLTGDAGDDPCRRR